MLEDCYHTQRTYGKEVAAYPLTVAAFIRALGKFPAAKIMPAFKKFVSLSGDFPTIADISAIIEERAKRDPALYRELLNRIKNGSYLSNAEHAYIRKYESQTLNDWDR